MKLSIEKKSLYLQVAILALPLILTSACGKGAPKSCLVSQTVQTAGNTQGLGLTGNGNQLAQSFVPTSTAQITNVEAMLIAGATVPAANTVTANIMTDNSGNPSTTSLASGSISTSNISSASTAFYNITISAVSLTSGTTYWLTLTSSYPNSGAANIISWAENTASAYPTGAAMFLNGSGGWNNLGAGTISYVFGIGSGC